MDQMVPTQDQIVLSSSTYTNKKTQTEAITTWLDTYVTEYAKRLCSDSVREEISHQVDLQKLFVIQEENRIMQDIIDRMKEKLCAQSSDSKEGITGGEETLTPYEDNQLTRPCIESTNQTNVPQDGYFMTSWSPQDEFQQEDIQINPCTEVKPSSQYRLKHYPGSYTQMHNLQQQPRVNLDDYGVKKIIAPTSSSFGSRFVKLATNHTKYDSDNLYIDKDVKPDTYYSSGNQLFTNNLPSGPNFNNNLYNAPNNINNLPDVQNFINSFYNAPNSNKNLYNAPNNINNLPNAQNVDNNFYIAPNNMGNYINNLPNAQNFMNNSPYVANYTNSYFGAPNYWNNLPAEEPLNLYLNQNSSRTVPDTSNRFINPNALVEHTSTTSYTTTHRMRLETEYKHQVYSENLVRHLEIMRLRRPLSQLEETVLLQHKQLLYNHAYVAPRMMSSNRTMSMRNPVYVLNRRHVPSTVEPLLTPPPSPISVPGVSGNTLHYRPNKPNKPENVRYSPY